MEEVAFQGKWRNMMKMTDKNEMNVKEIVHLI